MKKSKKKNNGVSVLIGIDETNVSNEPIALSTFDVDAEIERITKKIKRVGLEAKDDEGGEYKWPKRPDKKLRKFKLTQSD